MAALRGDDGRKPGAQEQNGKHDDSEIRARPGDAKTFSCPKHAKCGQQNADGEFEGILRHLRQGPADGKSRAGNQLPRGSWPRRT